MTNFNLFDTYGDSIDAGTGASPAAAAWAARFATYDAGYSGDQAADAAKKIIASTREVPQRCVLLVGVNDARIYQGDTAKREFTHQFMRTCAIWLLCPVRTLGRASTGVTKTGSWSNTSANNYGLATTQNGATWETTVTGPEIYLGYLIQNNENAHGAADVYIDGAKVDTINTFGAMTTYNGLAYATATKRYSGLSAGSHEVKLVVTSPAGQYFYVDYITGAQPGATKLLLCNITRQSAAGYSANGGSDTITDAYNADIETLRSELASDGFNIALIDNHYSIDPSTDLNSDGIHPNNAGHLKIFNNILNVL